MAQQNDAKRDAPDQPGGKGGSQEIARKAAEYAPEALETIYAHMRDPGRGTQGALQAARMILELAKELQPQAVQPGQLRLIDPKAAAEELARRQALKQGK